METVIIKLDSKKMSNPDLDIRYSLPERIEKISNGTVKENGFDYISDTELGIWLEAENAQEAAALIIDLIGREQILENDLSLCAEIAISSDECAEWDQGSKVFPR